HQEIVVDLVRRREAVDLDRGIDDRGVAAIAALDALLDHSRDGDVRADPLRRAIVPAPKQGYRGPQGEPRRPPDSFQLDVTIEGPEEARRGEAIADVAGMPADARAVAKAAGQAEDEVVPR